VNNSYILKSILAILIIQLVVLISNEFRFMRMESTINNFFAPIEDIELPSWEDVK
jgi:hypothetical protein